jgi:hypothetical protein
VDFRKCPLRKNPCDDVGHSPGEAVFEVVSVLVKACGNDIVWQLTVVRGDRFVDWSVFDSSIWDKFHVGFNSMSEDQCLICLNFLARP